MNKAYNKNEYDISIGKIVESLKDTGFMTDSKALVYVFKDGNVCDLDDKDLADTKCLHRIKGLRYDRYNSQYDILLNTEINPIKECTSKDTYISFLINKCGYSVYAKALNEYMHNYDIDSYIHMDDTDKELACMEYISNKLTYQNVLLIVIE